MTLAHDDAGLGQPVVLLHSTVGDRRMWDPQWQPLLDAGYRLVRCDFRGHGDSPVGHEQFNSAEDVRDLLDDLGLPHATLIGASYGGRVAQEMAARWPDRITAMALLCSATRLHSPTEDIIAFSDAEDDLLAAGDIEAAVELNVRTFLGADADETTRTFVADMQRHAFEVQLAAGDDAPDARNEDFDLTKVTAPTLVVSGGQDLDYFRQTAELLAAEIPGAQYVELPWAKHLPSLERPAETTALLLDFLGR
jgi:pimeloyl-ACP methyl ester carboxylesterase